MRRGRRRKAKYERVTSPREDDATGRIGPQSADEGERGATEEGTALVRHLKPQRSTDNVTNHTVAAAFLQSQLGASFTATLLRNLKGSTVDEALEIGR